MCSLEVVKCQMQFCSRACLALHFSSSFPNHQEQEQVLYVELLALLRTSIGKKKKTAEKSQLCKTFFIFLWINLIYSPHGGSTLEYDFIPMLLILQLQLQHLFLLFGGGRGMQIQWFDFCLTLLSGWKKKEPLPPLNWRFLIRSVDCKIFEVCASKMNIFTQ